MLYEATYDVLCSGDNPLLAELHYLILPAEQAETVDVAFVPAGGATQRSLGNRHVSSIADIRIMARAGRDHRHALIRTLDAIGAAIEEATGDRPRDLAVAPFNNWQKLTGAAAQTVTIINADFDLPSFVAQDLTGRLLGEIRGNINFGV